MDYNNIINFNSDRLGAETRRRAAVLANCLIESKGHGSRIPSDKNEPRRLLTKADRVSKWEKRWTNLGSTFVRVYKWVKVEHLVGEKLRKDDKTIGRSGGQVAGHRGGDVGVTVDKIVCPSLEINESRGTGPVVDGSKINGKLGNECEEKKMGVNRKDTEENNGADSVKTSGNDSLISDKDEDRDGDDKSEVDSLIDDPDDSSDGWNSAMDESKSSEDD